MADLKPPRCDLSERDTLMTLWQFQRDSMIRKVTGLSDLASRQRIVESATTLRWLISHVTTAESMWICARFAGRPIEAVDDESWDMDRLVENYRATSLAVDDVISQCPNLGEHCKDPEYADTPLRWVMAHLLEETARHAGHADILREIIDGRVGR